MGQQSRENDCYDRSQQNRLKHPHRQGKHRQLADRNTQDGSIRQPLRAVQRPLSQRFRVADPATFTFGQGLPNLRSVRVVLHLGGRDVGVEEYLAAGGDPGQAKICRGWEPIRRGQPLQIIQSVHLCSIGGQTELIPQLFLLHVFVIVIQTAHDDDQTCQKNGDRRQQDGTENFLCHGFASSR